MTSKRLIGIAKAAELLGVGISTLRAWDDSGALKAERTKGGHRRYRIEDIEQLQGVVSEDNPPNDCAAVELDKNSIGVYTICMQRVNFHLTENQIKSLRQLSDKTGLSVAELIRRALDDWLKRSEEKSGGGENTSKMDT